MLESVSNALIKAVDKEAKPVLRMRWLFDKNSESLFDVIRRQLLQRLRQVVECRRQLQAFAECLKK